MPREKRQDEAWFKEQDVTRVNRTKAQNKNNRRHLRFEVDEASALINMKGFLSAVGLRRSRRGLGVMNLSEGGVLLISDNKFQRGRKVRVRIEMAKYKDSFVSDGVVRWVMGSSRKDRGHYLGVEFTGLDSTRFRQLTRMKEWFTSPEFKARNAARLRDRMTEFRFGK